MMLSIPVWPTLIASGVFGAVLGSFLNVCIYRLPKGKSVVTPPSSCPGCGERIRPYDNVPVLAWFWLGGKCRTCRSRISIRYPIVEALTGGLFIFLAWWYGTTWELLPALYFGASMLLVTLIDFDEQIIPDSITLPGTLLGVLGSFLTPVTLIDSLVGASLGFLLFLGIAWGYRRLTGVDGMGGGDIKLAAMLGAFLGWQGLLLTVFLASLGGTLVGITMMIRKRGGRKTALPFGTFLAPAGFITYVWGPDLISWYASLLRPPG